MTTPDLIERLRGLRPHFTGATRETIEQAASAIESLIALAPHDDGCDSEGLLAGCDYCSAPAGEVCAKDCPTLNGTDPGVACDCARSQRIAEALRPTADRKTAP